MFLFEVSQYHKNADLYFCYIDEERILLQIQHDTSRTRSRRLLLYHVFLEVQSSLNMCKGKSLVLWLIWNVSSAAFWTKIHKHRASIRGKTSEMNGGLFSRGNPERRILETRHWEQLIYKSISTALPKHCEGDERFMILSLQMKQTPDKRQSE